MGQSDYAPYIIMVKEMFGLVHWPTWSVAYLNLAMDHLYHVIVIETAHVSNYCIQRIETTKVHTQMTKNLCIFKYFQLLLPKHVEA